MDHGLDLEDIRVMRYEPLRRLVFLAFRLEVGRWVRDPWTWLQGGALAIAGAVSVVHFAYMSRYVAAFASKLDVIMGKNLLEAFSPRRVLWLDPDYTSVAVIALFAVGIVWGLVHARRATIWAVSALFVVVLMGPPDQSGGLKLAYSRYQSLPLMLFCVIAGIGASGVVDLAKRGFGKLGRGVAAAALLVAVPLTSAGPVGRVCRATTIDLELQFLKDALMELPECAVIFAPFGPKVDVSGGFRDAWAVSFWLGRGKWREWPLDEPTPGCEKYFYRSPLCHVDTVGALASYPSAAVIFERCREGMTRAGDRPAVVTKLRPVPWGGETYPRERIEIGFYKLSE